MYNVDSLRSVGSDTTTTTSIYTSYESARFVSLEAVNPESSAEAHPLPSILPFFSLLFPHFIPIQPSQYPLLPSSPKDVHYTH